MWIWTLGLFLLPVALGDYAHRQLGIGELPLGIGTALIVVTAIVVGVSLWSRRSWARRVALVLCGIRAVDLVIGAFTIRSGFGYAGMAVFVAIALGVSLVVLGPLWRPATKPCPSCRVEVPTLARVCLRCQAVIEGQPTTASATRREEVG